MVEEDIEFITFDGDIITKSDYREEIINRYIQARYDNLTKITDFSIGSEAYYLTDLMANIKLEFREKIDTNYRMCMIHTAEGEFLDNFGDMCGVHRKGSSPSVGIVQFTRLSSDNSSQIIIPDGTVVSTDDAISFIVDNEGEDLIIFEGETSCTANVICEQEGSFTNVNPNTIILVMGELGALVKVTNPNSMIDGEDIEEDEDYRARILLSPYEVPAGTVGWYENVSLSLDSVHDVFVRKGTISSEPDIIITFNPHNWEDTISRPDINNYNEDNDIESTASNIMTVARANLVDTFELREYNVAGIKMGYHLAEKKQVLISNEDETYLFSVLVKENYILENLKQEIVNKIINFNKDALVGIEFSPHSLASIIENEVEGVDNCRIVKRTGYEDNYSYEEVSETISVNSDQIYDINIENILNRIVPLRFNIDLIIEE